MILIAKTQAGCRMASVRGIILYILFISRIRITSRSFCVSFPSLQPREGEPVVREPARTGGLAWCPLAGLPEPVPPHERAVLELLRESLSGGRAVPAITTFGFAPHYLAFYDIVYMDTFPYLRNALFFFGIAVDRKSVV